MLLTLWVTTRTNSSVLARSGSKSSIRGAALLCLCCSSSMFSRRPHFASTLAPSKLGNAVSAATFCASDIGRESVPEVSGGGSGIEGCSQRSVTGPDSGKYRGPVTVFTHIQNMNPVKYKHITKARNKICGVYELNSL